MRVACCQIRCQVGDADGNLALAVGAVEKAIRAGAQMIVLPEVWPCGFDLEHLSACEAACDDALQAMTEISEGWDGLLVVGSLILRSGADHHNELIVLHRGEQVATYRKMHLFAGLGEHEALARGREPAMLDTPLGPAGLALCYDLRFPELFRWLARRGARLFVVPSQWPWPRIEHWRLLARARAVENLAYLIGVNTAGNPEIDRLHGHSLVVDPWGETVWEAGQEETLGVVDLDPAIIDQCRERLPVARDVLPDLHPP